MRKHLGVLITVIAIIIIIIMVGVSKYKHNNQLLKYENDLNNLISKIINVKNNENIFHTINDESDIPHGNVNVLDIPGGGIRNTVYIVYLLRINNHYLNKNIDMLKMFNVFGGVSAGAIITGAIAYREIMLKHVAKNHKSEFIACMQLFKYSDEQMMRCIAWIESDSNQLNYGTLILQWLFYSFISLKDVLFNVPMVKRITTLDGYLHPMMSSKDKHDYLKKYFDFDIKSILNSRTFITCAIVIPNKLTDRTTNNLIIFTNDPKSFNPKMNPNMIPEYTITNMGDIINLSTHTIGLYPVNETLPFAWDATTYINNLSTIIIPLIMNHSLNFKLKYVTFGYYRRLVYENNNGLDWWIKNIPALIRIQTLYDMNTIKFFQKDKYLHVMFPAGRDAFDESNDALLDDIQRGINGSTVELIKFINDEISSFTTPLKI